MAAQDESADWVPQMVMLSWAAAAEADRPGVLAAQKVTRLDFTEALSHARIRNY